MQGGGAVLARLAVRAIEITRHPIPGTRKSQAFTFQLGSVSPTRAQAAAVEVRLLDPSARVHDLAIARGVSIPNALAHLQGTTRTAVI